MTERRAAAADGLRARIESVQPILDSILDYAIIVLDSDGNVTGWNAGARRLKGYEAGEIVGRHFSVFYPADAAADKRPARELAIAASAGSFEDEGWRVRRDGTRFWANVVISAIRDPDGSLIGFSKVTRDLTARREIDERLRRSQERLTRVVEATPNAIVMIDARGTIEMINTQAETLFGYGRAELLGRSIDLLVPDRYRAGHPGLRGQFFGMPRSRPMGKGRDLFALRKDGTEFPVEIGLNPIETEDGTKVLSAIVDLTTRKKLDERFRQVVESTPNAIVMINASGRIEMVNAQTERLFGYPREELLDRDIEILVPARFRTNHPGHRHSFFGAPRSRPMGVGRDLYALRKDGTEFPVEIGLNPIETDSGAMVLSAIVDISDRKNRELRLQETLKEKEVLLAEIHHRVKNNLQIVQSLLDLQSSGVRDPQALEMLKESRNRINSMALIHQILYESKDFARVDFDHVLKRLVPTLVSTYGGAPRVSVAMDTEELPLPLNAAIPAGLIVNELVSNALKHAFAGRPRGEIAVTLRRSGAGAFRLSVGDDGIGFDDGFDIAAAPSLGLKLVGLLTEQIGGSYRLSRCDPTRFDFDLPVARE